MKPQKKLRGRQPGAAVSELTRFKEMWRDAFTDTQRDYWRSQFVSQAPTRETRETLRLKHGINLTEDDQIVRFRKWDQQEQDRSGEAERMAADETFYRTLHPDWDSERLRQEVIDAASRRGLATGDFKLGLKSVATGSKVSALDFEKEKYLESKKSDQTKALELCLDEAKAFPEVTKLFEAAFAALAKAKTA